MNVYLMAVLGVLAIAPLGAHAVEYEGILGIAVQAHQEIESQMNSLDEVSETASILFAEGTAELELLKESVEARDPDAAKQHFLSVMDIFRQIPLAMSGNSHAAFVTDYTGELERAERFALRLENLASAHMVDADFGSLNVLLERARQQVNSGDAAAQSTINEINTMMADIREKLGESARQKATDRAREFAAKYVDKIDGLIDEAKELGYSDDTIKEFREARQRLADAPEPRQVIDEIRRLDLIWEQLELSKFDVLLSRADQAERDLDELDASGADLDAITDARSLVDELRASIYAEDYEMAQDILEELVMLISSIKI